MGTQVLAGIGSHGRADALQRDRQELCGLAAGRLGGHNITAQTVDGTLQHHAANGRNAALQAHGDAHIAELEAVITAEFSLFFGPAQLMVMPGNVPQAAKACHGLAEHRGKRSAEHAHFEDDDAEQVEADVQKACHQQEIQRTLAVAQSAHESAGNIIKQGERDAPEDGADVDVRQVDDIGRGIRPDQDGPGECHGHDGEHHRKGDAQPDRVGRVTAHLAVIFRAKRPGDGDGEAAGDAIDKAQHQIVQAAHAAHRRQRFHANKAADNDGIGQVVKLLEQAAQHQRHRKGKDQLERAALRHIFCHTIAPPMGGFLCQIFADKNALPQKKGRTSRFP